MILEQKIQILSLWLVLWFSILIFLLFMDSRSKRASVGISMAYLFNFFMNYFFGALIYVLPWYRTDEFDFVYLGFQQCLYAISAYAVGSLFLAPFLQRLFSRNQLIPTAEEPDRFLPWTYLVIGFFCYLVLGRLLVSIPTLRTCGWFGWFMLIAATCLFCWKAWVEEKPKKIFVILCLSGLFPFFTIFNSGFLSYGTVAVMTILFFVASFFKPRWFFLLLVFVMIYMGLSVCVTYFRDREELRQDIWSDRKSMTERIGRSINTFLNFEFLDLRDQDHLKRIDGRLNQAGFIGHSVVYLSERQVPFARGKTLWDALLSLVPRFLWPDKPVVAGGASNGVPLLVTYTGLNLDQNGTSWAVGQVLEFYINFGTAGVIIGFILLGALITCFDQIAAARLYSGDWRGFVFWFLPAISFMSAGTFVDMAGATVAFLILSAFLHKVVVLKIARNLSSSKATK